ncbi:MAG TPA: HDOD domain-containing protein [Rhodocyclaceae bacterium]|nr:HDOD domain-containing protein [Rhodocyclaceae bacterium]
MHSAQELVANLEALTSLPSVYVRIRETLDAPDGSLVEISRAITADPALTARLLKVVNSALYGYGGTIDSIHRAVTILGLQQVHDLVLAMSLSSVFSGIRPEQMDMARFWRGSMMCGIAAREIGRRCELATAERMLVIGLLADVGHLAMYQTVPALAIEAQKAADTNGEPLFQAERRIVGCDYAEVGATLMDSWKLPSCFAEVIGAQIHPRLAGSFTFEATALNLAAHIVHSDRSGATSEAAAAQVAPIVWTTLDIDPSAFGALREAAELDLAGYLALLFPEPHH